jgi:hypothetical protein
VQCAAVAGVLYTPQDGMQEKMELERTSPGDRSIDRWNTGMQLCEADLGVPMSEQACHVCFASIGQTEAAYVYSEQCTHPAIKKHQVFTIKNQTGTYPASYDVMNMLK